MHLSGNQGMEPSYILYSFFLGDKMKLRMCRLSGHPFTNCVIQDGVQDAARQKFAIFWLVNEYEC